MRRFFWFCIFLLTFALGVVFSVYHKAIVCCGTAVLHAREDVLKLDLQAMRQAISQYTSEKGSPPQSLDDLLRAGYFEQVPPDPITEKRNWRVILAPPEYPSKRPPGIVDVR